MNERGRACIERLSAIVLGAVLNFAAIPANAANSLYVNVSSCKCATTADFTGAAAQLAIGNALGTGILAGTLTMVSSTTARSAYIYVTLKVIPPMMGIMRRLYQRA